MFEEKSMCDVLKTVFDCDVQLHSTSLGGKYLTVSFPLTETTYEEVLLKNPIDWVDLIIKISKRLGAPAIRELEQDLNKANKETAGLRLEVERLTKENEKLTFALQVK